MQKHLDLKDEKKAQTDHALRILKLALLEKRTFFVLKKKDNLHM